MADNIASLQIGPNYTITVLDDVVLNHKTHAVDGSNIWNSGAKYDIGIQAKTNYMIFGGWNDVYYPAIVFNHTIRTYKKDPNDNDYIKLYDTETISRESTYIIIPKYICNITNETGTYAPLKNTKFNLVVIDYD